MDYSVYDKYIIKFNDWSEFKKLVESTIENGFNDESDFIEKVGLDLEKYDKIKKSLVNNWIDSISKSVIHSITNIVHDFPKDGENIFDDIKVQTSMIYVMGSGFSSVNIFGSYNSVEGLNIIPSHMHFDKIENLNKESSERYASVGGYKLVTTTNKILIDKINDIIKYVWCYVFLQDIKLKKTNIKLPKYLYRGIRKFPKKANITYRKYDDNYTISSAMNSIKIVEELVGKKVSDVLDGKFASFTSSIDVAMLFANKSGYVIRVKTDDIKIMSSELTEELFKEKNPITNRYEKEYIVCPKDSAIIGKDDIIISSEEYYMATASPLAINYISHDNRIVSFEYEHNGLVFHCEARGSWRSNDKFSVLYSVESVDGNINKEFRTWLLGRNEFIKEFGFNPKPTEKTMHKFKNVKVYDYDRYSYKKKLMPKI